MILQATVVAIGTGSKGKEGDTHPVSLKVGEKFLLLENDGETVQLDDKDCFIFRDTLGKYVD